LEDLIGATITGGIIQTAASGQRLVLTDADDSLTLYDASENQLFKLFVNASIIAGINTFAGSAADALNIAVAGTGKGIASEISNAANADSVGFFRTNGLGHSLYALVSSNASRTKPTLYLNAVAGQGAHIGLYPIATEPQTPSEGEIYANEDGNVYYYNGSTFESLNRATVVTLKEAGEDLVEGDTVYLSLGKLAVAKGAENTTGATDAVIWDVKWGGQTFLFTQSQTITKVNVRLRKVLTPVGNITLEIFATSAGEPTGAALASSVLVADDAIGAAYASIEFTLASALDIDADTTYALIWKVPDTDEANRVEAQFANSGNPYAGGTFLYSLDSGSNWTIESTYDFRFDIYGKPIAGKVYKTDASFDDERTLEFLGFVNATITAGSNGNINVAGKQSGLSGLTPDITYFLSDTAGEISSVPGTYSIEVGRSLSATELLIGNILKERPCAVESDPGYTASDTVRHSNDAEYNTNSLTYVKLKEILLNDDLPVFRVKFYLRTDVAASGFIYGRIYKNGVAEGAEITCNAVGWEEKSEDHLGFVAGDLLQIYVKCTSPRIGYIKDMDICYDHAVSITHLANTVLDTPLVGVHIDTVISVTNQDP